MKKIIFASLVAMVLISCGGGINVYVSGSNDSTAVYWKNGQQNNLDNGGLAANTSGIVIDSGVVYVSGTCNDATNNKACYWKDGTKTTLKVKSGDDWPTRGNGIYVANNKVYVAGYIAYMGAGPKATAAYWTDNTESCVEVSNPLAFSNAATIFVDTGSIYVGGSENYFEYIGEEKATYWNNNSPVVVGDGAINSMYVSGGKVYTAGNIILDETKTTAVCYIDNQKQTLELPSDTTSSEANGIYVSGTDVYVSGDYFTVATAWTACYWKNGKRTDLLPTSTSAEITYPGTSGIFVKNGDVYVSGSYQLPSYKTIACYWKNGIKTDLTFSVENSYADTTGIFVE